METLPYASMRANIALPHPFAHHQRKAWSNSMKRYTFLLLLTLLLLFSLPALAQEVFSEGTAGKAPGRLFRVGDTSYVHAGHELYALDSSGQPAVKAGNLPDNLFFLSGDEDFLAVQTDTGTVYQFSQTESGISCGPIAQLDLSGMQDSINMIEQGVFTGGYVCLLAFDEKSSSFYSTFLFNLSSGSMLPQKIKDAWDICIYEPGKILVYLQPLGGRGEISACDPATAQTQKLLDVPEGSLAGLAYDRAGGTTAITGNGAVYVSSHGAPFTEGGYLNINMQSNTVRAVLSSENTYIAIVPNEAAFLCDIGALNAVKPLRIAGSDLSEETVAAYRKLNPDKPVVYVKMNILETDILALQLVLRTGDVDIYVMPAGLPIYTAMLEKGFALDLSGEQDLVSAVSAMYPRMAEVVRKDGKLYGLPVDVVNHDALGYNPKLFAQSGLTVPQTLFELMDQLEALGQREDTALMDARLAGPSQTVLRYILYTYLSAATAKSHGTAFDPETFRSLVARWEAIAPTLEKDGARSALMESPALFCNRFFFMPGHGSFLTEGYEVLPLAIGEGKEKILPAAMNAMIVNPASANQAEAIRFLAFYAQNMPGQQRIAMYPNENDPVADPEMQQRAMKEEANIQLLTAQLSACAPEEKKQLTEQLEQARQTLASWQADMWAIGPEEIKAYRGIADMLIFGREDVGFSTHDKQIYDLCNQLGDGGIDSARFCDAFIGIWEMAWREE